MNRQDVWGILGSVMLFGMAYVDAGWRWFWAFAGAVILAWSIYTIISPDDDDLMKPWK
jgi:hypothetical protein